MEELFGGESRRPLGGCRRTGTEKVAAGENVAKKGGCGRDRWEGKSEIQRKGRRKKKERRKLERTEWEKEFF